VSVLVDHWFRPSLCIDCKKMIQTEVHILACHSSLKLVDSNFRFFYPETFLKQEHKTLLWEQNVQDVEAVIKVYCHRSFLTRWREKTFQFRVEREFEALSKLYRVNIPTSQPLFWGYGNCAQFGRIEALAMRKIPNVIPLKEFLQKVDKKTDPLKFEILFQHIRQMHEAGIYHGALSPKNILVTASPATLPTFYIIDMAQSILFSKAITGAKFAWYDLLNIARGLKFYCQHVDIPPLLAHYGFSEAKIEAFTQSLNQYNPSKHTRNYLRGEFLFRRLLGR